MISIIIPVYNQHLMTKECLQSIFSNTVGEFEVIIIDNGSNPVYSWHDIKDVRVKIINNKENLGFPKAINQGMEIATGRTIVLLNNDCIVTPGWTDKMAWWLQEPRQIEVTNFGEHPSFIPDKPSAYSIIGPVTNYCAGLQQVSIPVYQNESELNDHAEEWSMNHRYQSQEVNWIIGFCMMFPKSLFDSIGPFDESFWPCCGEEVDWCVRAKQSGYRIGIAKDVYIHHFGNQTFNDLERAGQINYQDTCKRNDMHLAQRWGESVFIQEIQPVLPEGIKLNLGCGFRKLDRFINIDNRAEVEPDVVANILNLPYADNSIDYIRAYDVLEHIPLGKQINAITEIWRVLKPGGIFESLTPSTDGRGAFQDPTHVSFWNKNSFLYYSDKDCRELYNIQADFELIKNEDEITNADWNIIHTHVIAKARKEM